MPTQNLSCYSYVKILNVRFERTSPMSLDTVSNLQALRLSVKILLLFRLLKCGHLTNFHIQHTSFLATSTCQ